MSINNKVAVLLEEKLWHIKECTPSQELTKKFLKILDLLYHTNATIIKMRYGINPEEYNYKWKDILNELNKTQSTRPFTMHQIIKMEKNAWSAINRSLQISQFDIACNDLFNFINGKGTDPQFTPCVGGWI